MRVPAAFRALLHCYPAAFREEYGGQMRLMFAEQLDAARRGGPLRTAALWVGATFDALTIAPKEHCHVILQDLRYALRLMVASPGFTTVAILSLALGIGANTAIFSLWNGVLHAPLPVVYRPDELVILTDPSASGSWTGMLDGPRSWLTYGEFEQLRDQAEGFSGLTASQSSLNTWPVRFEGGSLEEVRGRLVSGGFFQVLGVGAWVGRVFTTAEDHADSPYAVISYNYWQRRFGGRSEVLGKTLGVNRALLTVIGVAPPGFIGETVGQQPDVWVPLRMQPAVLPGRDRLHDKPPEKQMWLQVFGRLKPGVTLAQADARANAVFQAGLEPFYGGEATGERRRQILDQRLIVRPGAQGASPARAEFSSSLTALLAGVGVLLLIACANLANLLLARGAVRKSEIALRLSLGASRGRIIRQLVTESLALTAIGGAAAIWVSSVLHGVLVRMMAEADDRFRMSFDIHPVVLAFVLTVTFAAALLVGVLPAWQVTSLKQESRGDIGSRGGIRSGRLLVCLQLALSLPLLVSAGLLARTFYNLEHADLGYSSDRLFLMRLDLHGARPERADELLGQIRRTPGVRAASYSSLGIFSGGESESSITVEGYVAKGDNDRASALDNVGPRYFSTLGIPILLGREILESDRGTAKVCVINESFAKRFFDRRNPIGMHISLGSDRDSSYEVVGVAKNARTTALRGDVAPRFFVRSTLNTPTFLIRPATSNASVMASVRQAMQSASVREISAATMAEQMAPLTAQDRTTAQLALVFGSVALVLAAIGLYGVLSYGVARRTGEIAVRIALGALPGRVVWMILRETMGGVLAGMVLGGGLALAASQLIQSRLYNVPPQDPLTLGLAAGLLLLTALGAAYLPARRASSLDPMAALRRE